MNYECRHIVATDIPDAWFQCVYNILLDCTGVYYEACQ